VRVLRSYLAPVAGESTGLSATGAGIIEPVMIVQRESKRGVPRALVAIRFASLTCVRWLLGFLYMELGKR
jgi:hypothetical protein